RPGTAGPRSQDGPRCRSRVWFPLFPVFLVPSVLLVPQCGLVMAIASVFPSAGNGSLLPCLTPFPRVRRRAGRTAQRGILITLEAFDSGPYSAALIDTSPPADTRP